MKLEPSQLLNFCTWDGCALEFAGVEHHNDIGAGKIGGDVRKSPLEGGSSDCAAKLLFDFAGERIEFLFTRFRLAAGKNKAKIAALAHYQQATGHDRREADLY